MNIIRAVGKFMVWLRTRTLGDSFLFSEDVK